MTLEDRYVEGALLAQRKEYDAALAVLNEVIAADPTHLDALEVIGLIHLERQDHEQAEEVFRRMLAIDPESTMAHVNLSRLYQRQGRIEEAESMQARARRLGLDRSADRASGAGAASTAGQRS